MTQVQEWGPHIWKILHYHAEYAGNSVMLADEIRTWTGLLRNTEGILACALCREHYRGWRAAHPIEEFVGQHKDIFHELLRKWLWDLHEYVNNEKDVPAERRLTFEQLGTYKEIPRQEIFQSISTLKEILQRAVLHRQVNPIYPTEWFRALKFLQKLLF
jgi:hypothetical protein